MTPTSPIATLSHPTEYPQAVLRLTALWAVVESGVGGVLHAFRLPLTGLVVGGTAVVLITLIAHFASRPREILRATLVVLIVKALVSPHAPLGAYVAVSFQGALGWLVYSLGRPGYATSVPYGVAALLESALQKLLTLVIVFGEPLRAAVDAYGAWAATRLFPGFAAELPSLSGLLVWGYVGLYLVGGLAVGWFAARVAPRLRASVEERHVSRELTAETVDPPEPAAAPRPPGRRRRRVILVWAVASLVLAVGVWYGLSAGERAHPLADAAVYLTRTLGIVLLWYFAVGPWLARRLRGWLLGRRAAYAEELDEVLGLAPAVRRIAREEYARLAQRLRGPALYRAWLLAVVASVLTVRLPAKPTLRVAGDVA